MIQKNCVVLGDVVNSREIQDRETFQETLQSTLSEINTQFDDALRAPFKILKGVDEIGGVLKSIRPLVTIQRQLARSLHPQQIRLAAVVGEIDVNAATGDVSAMDGEAFARADRVLDELESTDFTFELEGTMPLLDGVLSDEINLLDMFRETWTERQVEIISKYERLDSQKEVAESLDISPQAVSNVLTKTKGDKIVRLEQRLSQVVEQYPSLDGHAAKE